VYIGILCISTYKVYNRHSVSCIHSAVVIIVVI